MFNSYVSLPEGNNCIKLSWINWSQTIPNPTKDQGRDDRPTLGPTGHPVCVAGNLHLTHRGAEKWGKKTPGNLCFFLWNHLQVCLDPPSTHKHICLMCFTSYVTYVYIYVYILLHFFWGEWSGRWFLICPCVGSVLDRKYPSIGEY